MSTVPRSDTALGRWEIDELLERYVWWSEERYEVRQAYQRWADSDRGERALAHAAYLGALDREERAARIYADHVDRIARIGR